jgi:4a-hydroxytetrahydrobiopterin dehydratase
VARLDDDEITSALQALGEWTRDDQVLVRVVRRRNWQDAIALVNRIAQEAERRGHHPDLCVTRYRTVTVRLTSHDVEGITDRDVALATWIEDRLRP